jgi:hypothetical protein
MSTARIKFIAQGHSWAIGNFAPGDVLRCSAEVARHLVEEAGCAEYETPPAAAKEAPAPGAQLDATQPRAARPRRATKPEQVQE